MQKQYALLAQLVEHLTLKQGVQGSSPWRRTLQFQYFRGYAFLLRHVLKYNEAWLSLVERCVRDAEVASSNLVASTRGCLFSLKNLINALLAQLVEHLTLNQGVQGSSPWRRTKLRTLVSTNVFFRIQKFL